MAELRPGASKPAHTRHLLARVVRSRLYVHGVDIQSGWLDDNTEIDVERLPDDLRRVAEQTRDTARPLVVPSPTSSLAGPMIGKMRDNPTSVVRAVRCAVVDLGLAGVVRLEVGR